MTGVSLDRFAHDFRSKIGQDLLSKQKCETSNQLLNIRSKDASTKRHPRVNIPSLVISVLLKPSAWVVTHEVLAALVVNEDKNREGNAGKPVGELNRAGTEDDVDEGHVANEAGKEGLGEQAENKVGVVDALGCKNKPYNGDINRLQNSY